MRRVLILLTMLSLSLAVLLPGSAAADGSVYTLRGVDGNHLVMVTHNVHEPQAKIPVTYNFRLYTFGGHAVGFDKVQVHIKQNSRLIFGKSLLVSDFKDAELTYSYPKSGAYTLSLRYIKDNKLLAGSDFPILVKAGADQGGLAKVFSVQATVAFLLGIAVTKLYLERNRLKQLIVKKKR